MCKEDLLCDHPWHKGDARPSVVPWILPSPFFKNERGIPFSSNWGLSLTNMNCQIWHIMAWLQHQTVSSCMPSSSIDLWLCSFIKWSWTCSLFRVGGTSLSPATHSEDLREVGSLTTCEDRGKELIDYLSLLHISCHQFTLVHQWQYALLGLFFLTCIIIPYQVLFQYCLSFPQPISTHSNNVHLLSLYHLSSYSSVWGKKSLLSHANFHPAMLNFSHRNKKLLCSKKNVFK